MARSRGGEIIISWSLELNETANDNAAHNKEPNKEAKDDAKQLNASFASRCSLLKSLFRIIKMIGLLIYTILSAAFNEEP